MDNTLSNQFAAHPLDFYYHALLLLPVAVAVYRREFLTPVLLGVALYFAQRFLEESFFLQYALLRKNNQTLSMGVLLIDILLLGGTYYLSFADNRVAKKLTLLAAGAVFGLCLVNYLLVGSASISRAGIRLLMVVLALLYFNKILSENRVRRILWHSMFWVSAGFLFYGTGTFLTNLFYDFLLDPALTTQATYDFFIDLDQLLGILHCVFIAIGLWVSHKDQQNYIQII